MPIYLDPIFSFVSLSHFMVDTFNASRPVLLTYFGLSEYEIALFSSIYIWASALTQPLFGWLSDRMGPRWLAGGGVQGGQAIGATDDLGFFAVEDKVHVNDLHATMLSMMGLDHERLTYRYAGRDYRLTDVHGRVPRAIVG